VHWNCVTDRQLARTALALATMASMPDHLSGIIFYTLFAFLAKYTLLATFSHLANLPSVLTGSPGASFQASKFRNKEIRLP
jgi:hypothetical protein